MEASWISNMAAIAAIFQNGRQQQLFSYEWWIENDVSDLFTNRLLGKCLLDHKKNTFNFQDGRHYFCGCLIWLIPVSNQSFFPMQNSNFELWNWPEASFFNTTDDISIHISTVDHTYDPCFFQDGSHMAEIKLIILVTIVSPAPESYYFDSGSPDFYLIGIKWLVQ